MAVRHCHCFIFGLIIVQEREAWEVGGSRQNQQRHEKSWPRCTAKHLRALAACPWAVYCRLILRVYVYANFYKLWKVSCSSLQWYPVRGALRWTKDYAVTWSGWEVCDRRVCIPYPVWCCFLAGSVSCWKYDKGLNCPGMLLRRRSLLPYSAARCVM